MKSSAALSAGEPTGGTTFVDDIIIEDD